MFVSGSSLGPDIIARKTNVPSRFKRERFWLKYDFPMKSIIRSTPSVCFLISSSKSGD